MNLKVLKHLEVRFLFVGILNTIFGYGVYAGLLFLNVNYLVANTVSTLLGIIHSYLWNRNFTFKSREKIGKEFFKFFSVYLVSYFIGTCTLYIFKNFLNLNPYLSGFLNLFITTMISWFGHKMISFNEHMRFSVCYEKYKKYFVPIGLFLGTFTLLLMYKNVNDFIDEANVMLGAKMLSQGKFIYADFASQHLPFMYFLIAPFAFLGVNSVVGFRIGMYLWLAILWTFMYCRYSKYFGKTIMCLYPVCYIMMMSVPNALGTTVISEQIQSQCLVMLLLEIILFFQNKKIDMVGKIVIPISMVIAIGVAFVSILPCLFVLVTFFYLDISNYKEKNGSLKKYFGHFWREYKVILLIGFGLVFLFVGYLIFTGSLLECYKQAFYLNMNIYSKYNNYSSNPLITIFNILPSFFLSIKYYMSFRFVNIFYCSLWIGIVLCFIDFFKKDILFSIFFLFLVTLCGNRSFVEFHALPFYAGGIICGLFYLKKIPKKYNKILLIVFLILFICQCGEYFSNIRTEKTYDKEYFKNVNLIAESDELFHIDLKTQDFLYSDKIPASRFDALVPWFSEVYEKEILDTIKRKNPNVIFYKPYNAVWGYLYKDFSPNICSYILKNYLFVSRYNLWIHKDKFENSETLLKRDLPEYDNSYNKISTLDLVNNYVEQSIVPEMNVKKLGIKFSTNNRINYSVLNIEIFNDNERILSKKISASSLENNNMYYLNFNKSLSANTEYILKISSEYTNFSDFVSIYKVSNELGVDSNKLFINGVKHKENLYMEMYYEKKSY